MTWWWHRHAAPVAPSEDMTAAVAEAGRLAAQARQRATRRESRAAWLRHLREENSLGERLARAFEADRD